MWNLRPRHRVQFPQVVGVPSEIRDTRYICGSTTPWACSAGALAQDGDLVCKARVRICLYERFPRFHHFVLILRQPCHGAPWHRSRGLRVSGLRASPIILRPEISHPLLIRPAFVLVNSLGFVPHKLQRLWPRGTKRVLCCVRSFNTRAVKLPISRGTRGRFTRRPEVNGF